MNRNVTVILTTLKAGLNRETTKKDPGLTGDEWEEVFTLSREQKLMPVVMDSLVDLPSVKSLEKDRLRTFKENAVSAAVRQIIQTNEFLTLILHAQQKGFDPIVIKGVICRSLYPKPMLRPSLDEDILIPASQVEAYHGFFLQEGLFADDPDADLKTEYEFSYHKENSPTYIEVHTQPFPPDNEAYGELNDLFEGVFDRTVRVQIEDVSVRTLAPTDHLLYILCHAYKHFLHGGIGLRQVCDIAMMTRAYETQIDWTTLFSKCKQIRIERFAAALYRITEQYLGFSVPGVFSGIQTDERDLLEDILSGGDLGTGDIDRMHSASITLEAASALRRGKRSGGVLTAAFPKAASLQNRYPYLKKRPWLLPVAWSQRISKYLLHRGDTPKGKPGRSIQIGRERVELLKEYGIID